MNEPFKISLVTPSFNQGEFIEETICSVLDQNYSNLEYIIVDGGSEDNTVEIIKKYQKYLKYWISEKDRGQSDAINKGLRHCTGEIFNWLNSDDLLIPGTLELVSEQFNASSHLHIVSGQEVFFEESHEYLKYGTIVYEDLEFNIVNPVFYQPSTFWRREVFSQFQIDKQLHYLMDTDLWLQYLLKFGKGGVKKVDHPFVRFRLHQNSKSISQSTQFSKERWVLRRCLYIQSGKKDEKALHAMDQLSRGSLPLKEYKIIVKVDHEKIEKLILKQLLIDCYEKGLYQSASYIFSQIWRNLSLSRYNVIMLFKLIRNAILM